MSTVALCLDDGAVARLAPGLRERGCDVLRVSPAGLGRAGVLEHVSVLVVPADPRMLTAGLVAVCDHAGVRIVPIAATDRDAALAVGYGLAPARALHAEAVLSAAAAEPPRTVVAAPGALIAVWGAPGAPGRSTVAACLAIELARQGRTCLIDADTHAPSQALLLGLDDDGPGIAGACRQAGRSLLTAAEYDRIRLTLPDGPPDLDVLVGLNRPARWPELRADRLTAALTVVSARVRHVVVDIAAPIEEDEPLVTDTPDAPRRNAATATVLAVADRVVMVTGCDAVGVARTVRSFSDLRRVLPHTPVTVVVNRLRSSAAGVDARAQVRRTLERFAGAEDFVYVPDDPATADRAVLHARPAALLAPRSALAVGVRQLAERWGPAVAAARGSARRRRERVASA